MLTGSVIVVRNAAPHAAVEKVAAVAESCTWRIRLYGDSFTSAFAPSGSAVIAMKDELSYTPAGQSQVTGMSKAGHVYLELLEDLDLSAIASSGQGFENGPALSEICRRRRTFDEEGART